MDIGRTVDEGVREDVVSDRDLWHGRMIHVRQPILVNTNFTFPSTMDGLLHRIRGWIVQDQYNNRRGYDETMK